MSKSELTVVAGSIEITPPEPCALAGFSAREGAFTRVADPLELNGILLRQGGHSLLIISADLLYVGDQVESALRDELDEAGLPDCHSLIGASHTHFAPNVDPTKPLLGEVSVGYVAFYLARAVELVRRLLETRPVVAGLSLAETDARMTINRRRLRWRLDRQALLHHGVMMQPNSRGPVDSTLRALRIVDRSGVPVAVLWNYACHPVCFPRRHEVSADYVGVARRRLRERLDHALPVVFLQGFAGDIRPPAVRHLGLRPRLWMSRALTGRRFGRMSESEWERWTRGIANHLIDATADSGRALRPCLSHGSIDHPLSDLIDGKVGENPLRISRVGLASELQIVALTAEVVIEYEAHLHRAFPELQTIPVACAGAVFGYLPTWHMLHEGGYEAGEFFRGFSLQGAFKPTVEDLVAHSFEQLAEEYYRQAALRG